MLRLNSFRSPRSLREWWMNQAILDVRPSDDSESFEVEVAPKDVRTFLGLRHLLDEIQAELDQTWAVLGEVYSRFSAEKLDRLGLNIRRVRSNIDNVVHFAPTVSYIPQEVKFDVAGASLVKLLITPLYGDDPSMAVRELIQNSVDAVRERDFLEANGLIRKRDGVQHRGAGFRTSP